MNRADRRRYERQQRIMRAKRERMHNFCKKRYTTYIKDCPNCKSKHLIKAHIASARLPFWWHIECWDCHWCGKTKLFLWRAVRSWNKERRDA